MVSEGIWKWLNGELQPSFGRDIGDCVILFNVWLPIKKFYISLPFLFSFLSHVIPPLTIWGDTNRKVYLVHHPSFMYQIGKEEEVKDGFKQDKSLGDPNTI